MLTTDNLLAGHTSEDTAYVVDDYPYGFRLRCKIRYWIETSPKHGDRFCSQTTNPKVAGERWNKPKKSTYSAVMAMYMGDDGHVSVFGVSQWSPPETLTDFLEVAGPHLNEHQRLQVAQLRAIARVRKHVTVSIHQGPFTAEDQAEQDRIKRELGKAVLVETQRALGEPLTTAEAAARLAAMAARMNGEDL